MKTPNKRALGAPVKLILGLLGSCLAATALAQTPAKPAIDWLPTTVEHHPVPTITWHMWWGNNGDAWQLLSNGELVCSGLLTPNGKNGQSSQCQPSLAVGEHALRVSLCLIADCNFSDVRNITITGAANTPPGLSWSLPDHIERNSPFSLGATASDADGSITQVQFYQDGQLAHTAAVAPYAFELTLTDSLPHSFRATAQDNLGATTSIDTSLQAAEPPCQDCNQPPTVTLEAPNQAIPDSPVAITVGATDTDGLISSLSLFLDDALLASGAQSPMTLQWQALAGQHTLRAVAVDDAGGRAETQRAITVAEQANCGIQPTPQGGYTLCAADLAAAEAQLTDSPLFRAVRASIATLANAKVEVIAPLRSQNPDNVKRVEALLPAQDWDFLFPLANSEYNYTRFLRALGKFPGLCATYTDGRDSDAICRKSLATLFAHFTQETGAHDPNSPLEQWRQGLYFVREAGCSDSDTRCGYNAECSPDTWQGRTWPCGTDAQGNFLKYYGRGAKQLSYNYNYGPFSEAMFGDVGVLLQDPDRVANSWLNLASATFFFVYPQAPKPSMLHVVDGTWQPNAHDASLGIAPGFGATTNIINGGIECNTQGAEKPQSINRIAYYRGLANYLQVPIAADEQLGCAQQGRFDTGGAGALLINWDQDWGWYPNNPEGKSFACKLVGYQTAFNALTPGAYRRCVTHYFPVHVID